MSSPLTRRTHYVAYAEWVDVCNGRCWCRTNVNMTGRWCRGCQRRWLMVDAISIKNDLEAAEDAARRSVAY